MSWISAFCSRQWITCLALPASLLTSCAVVLDDQTEDDSAYTWEYEHWDSFPESNHYEFMQCQAPVQAAQLCGLRPNPAGLDYSYRWRANCRGGECNAVSVFAHYTLPEDIGRKQTLVIEAFDNPRFQGSPAAALQIYGFDASRPHSSDREEVYLAPGEYYFRAYLTGNEQQPIPYPLGDLELVGDKPVGVYGALSGAKRVVVKPNQQTEAIHISIDQLFKKPGTELPLQSRLRLKLQVEPKTYPIPSYRQVRILLLNKPDVESKPEHIFTMSSQLLMVQGQEFQAEFLSPDIRPGAYYLFSYLDADGNGYFDAGEPAGLYKENSQPTPILLEADHTRTLYLVLRSSLED